MVSPISRNHSPASNFQREAVSESADLKNSSECSYDSFDSWRIPKQKNVVQRSITGIRRFLNNVSTSSCMKGSSVVSPSAVGSMESKGPFVMNFERSDSLFINPTPKERESVLKQLTYPNSIMMKDNTSYRISPHGVSPIARFGSAQLLGHLERVESPPDLNLKSNVNIEFFIDRNHLDDRSEPIGLVKKTIRRGESGLSSSFKNILSEAINTFALTGPGNRNVARVKEIFILQEEQEVVILFEHVEGIGLHVRERVDGDTYFPKSMMTVPDRHPGNYGLHKGVVTHIDFDGARGQPAYAAALQNKLLEEIEQADGKPIHSRKQSANE
jgi:hypothetical protein